jgi:hypothetical protein
MSFGFSQRFTNATDSFRVTELPVNHVSILFGNNSCGFIYKNANFLIDFGNLESYRQNTADFSQKIKHIIGQE